jgi:hypothetical protein
LGVPSRQQGAVEPESIKVGGNALDKHLANTLTARVGANEHVAQPSECRTVGDDSGTGNLLTGLLVVNPIVQRCIDRSVLDRTWSTLRPIGLLA